MVAPKYPDLPSTAAVEEEARVELETGLMGERVYVVRSEWELAIRMLKQAEVALRWSEKGSRGWNLSGRIGNWLRKLGE